MIFPTVNISPTALKPNTIFPLVPTIQSVLSPSLMPTPLFSTSLVPNINNDSDLREKVSEYFYKKIYNNWLKYQYLDLYKLLSVKNGVVVLSKSDTNTDFDVKYEYIMKKFLSKNDIYTLLKHFIKINQLNWWELKEYSNEVKNFIYHKVKKYMKHELDKITDKTK